MKKSEAKRSETNKFWKRNKQIFGSETKRKCPVLISLWSEAKNMKRKEAKNCFFPREHAKHAKWISFRFVSL
jgi:hypothetical protein